MNWETRPTRLNGSSHTSKKLHIGLVREDGTELDPEKQLGYHRVDASDMHWIMKNIDGRLYWANLSFISFGFANNDWGMVAGCCVYPDERRTSLPISGLIQFWVGKEVGEGSKLMFQPESFRL